MTNGKTEIGELADELGIKTTVGIHALQQAIENVQLFDRKQQDYGPDNIGIWSELGVIVKCTDKIMRLRNLYTSGRAPNFESSDNCFKDFANYGLIGQLICKGLWPATAGLPLDDDSRGLTNGRDSSFVLGHRNLS